MCSALLGRWYPNRLSCCLPCHSWTSSPLDAKRPSTWPPIAFAEDCAGGGGRQAVVAPAQPGHTEQVVGEDLSGGATQVGCWRNGWRWTDSGARRCMQAGPARIVRQAKRKPAPSSRALLYLKFKVGTRGATFKRSNLVCKLLRLDYEYP